MLKAKLAAFASALILAGTAFASQDICPELSAIQAEGISMAMEVYGFYAAYQISDYNTNNSWGFVIAPIEVGSEEEAIENGNDILKGMTAPGVRVQEDVCQYKTNIPGIYALAVADELPTAMKLRQYIHR
jgi:hypothetical protein